MPTEDEGAVAEAIRTLVAALGPVPFVVLALAGLLIWQAPKLWRRSENATAAPSREIDETARAIGQLEGTVKGLQSQLDEHDDRIKALEQPRSRSRN